MTYVRWFSSFIMACAFATSAVNASDRVFRNEEYAYQIAVPRGHHVCVGKSWEHPHGFFYNIDATPDCDPDATGRMPSSIHIWADHNAASLTSAREITPDCRIPPYGRSLRAAFPNKVRSWQSCISYQAHNAVRLELVILAGRFDGRGEDGGKPCVIYEIFLRTYRDRLARDVTEFRKFISKTKIFPGDCED